MHTASYILKQPAENYSFTILDGQETQDQGAGYLSFSHKGSKKGSSIASSSFGDFGQTLAYDCIAQYLTMSLQNFLFCFYRDSWHWTKVII